MDILNLIYKKILSTTKKEHDKKKQLKDWKKQFLYMKQILN